MNTSLRCFFGVHAWLFALSPCRMYLVCGVCHKTSGGWTWTRDPTHAPNVIRFRTRERTKREEFLRAVAGVGDPQASVPHRTYGDVR